MKPTRKRSADMRLFAYVYACMAIASFVFPSVVWAGPMFVIMATIFAVGGEILKEFDR